MAIALLVKMTTRLCSVVFLFGILTFIHGNAAEYDQELFHKCFTDDNMLTLRDQIPENIDPICVEFFMKFLSTHADKFKATEEQLNFLRSVEREGLGLLTKARTKRQARRQPSNLLVRRECRALSQRERDDLFEAMRILKFNTQNNVFDFWAGIHGGFQSFRNAHLGSNFYGWHRVYLYYFERTLRRVRNTALCYWDTTMDYLIPNNGQANTTFFTSRLLGNGRGAVINGPNRFWPIPGTNLTVRRDIARAGSLMRPRIVDMIMNDPTIISHSQITFDPGNANVGFPDPEQPGRRASLEGEHNNPHVWVGEVMANADITPQDMCFWLHHTYVDYVWEGFRQKMIRFGRDPSTDYPGHGDPTQHGADIPMYYFSNISTWWNNRNGYTNLFTQLVYTYADHPTCANGCGGNTEFLYCPDDSRSDRRCVARTTQTDTAPRDVITFGGRTAAGFSFRTTGAAEGTGSIQQVDAVAISAANAEGPTPRAANSFTTTFTDPRI